MNSTRPASGATNLQPTLISKHPGPASQSPQIRRQPVPANPASLRLGGAVTSCTYGHGHSRAHLHGHGHAHTCTAMVRKPTRRDQRPALADQAPTGPLKSPEPASHLRRFTRPANSLKPPGGHGHQGTASLRDAATTGACIQARPKACACGPGRGSPRNLDRLDSTKVSRCGAGSRRTNDGSRRPPARPGVTLAPGSAVSTSLLYHVFLEAPR